MARSDNDGPAGAARTFAVIIRGVWDDLIRGLTDSYRPERHYMRGPGPKWRAKHVRAGG